MTLSHRLTKDWWLESSPTLKSRCPNCSLMVGCIIAINPSSSAISDGFLSLGTSCHAVVHWSVYSSYMSRCDHVCRTARRKCKSPNCTKHTCKNGRWIPTSRLGVSSSVNMRFSSLLLTVINLPQLKPTVYTQFCDTQGYREGNRHSHIYSHVGHWCHKPRNPGRISDAWELKEVQSIMQHRDQSDNGEE